MSKKKTEVNEQQIKLDLHFTSFKPKRKTVRGLNKILRPPCCLGLKAIST